ncbi:MAG: EAL domain-containing protein [Gammaproteobacteria bacterium]
MQEQENTDSFCVFWRNSLVAKFVSLTVVVVFVLMSISAYINYRSQVTVNVSNLKTQNAMLGSFVADIAQESMLSHDYNSLNNYMQEIGDGEDVVYAAIFSPRGNALASYVEKRNTFVSDMINEKNEVDAKHIISRLGKNRQIIHLRYPIIFDKKVLGHFVMGISKVRMQAQSRNQLFSTILASTLFSVLLGFGIYVVFRIYTLRPIQQLVRGAHRVARGKLDQDVKVYSHDELGRLAVTFNQMMQHIKQTSQEKDGMLNQIQEMNLSLEKRVEQRTEELEVANQKLEKLALHDSLTNLPNRFCIQDNLNRGIADAKLSGSTFAVIMMDLDRFKEINDTLGHDCGDQLLVAVGRRLQSVLRPTDLIGRLGGDEFAILLPDTDEQGAGIVAGKIQSALDAPFNLADMAFSIGASLGIAAFPRHGNTTSILLKAADVAMYHAKNNKLGYCIYNAILDIHTPDRLSLIMELRDAIHNDDLMLFYQPKLDLDTRRIVGLEALLRWQHKDRGFIPPAEFIPMAEQSGLIRQLTYWVISTALLQLDAWHRAGLGVAISLNLSMQNLQDPDFPEQLAQLLDQAGVDNRFIQFEITESVIMSNPGHVMGVLAALGKMGVSFAIDDFGTGYSSLSTLKRLQVQEIKIDKSFVMDMATDKDDESIVHSIVDMAHNLGLTVTAEGVESENTLKQLEKLGCNMIQGYRISRPLPPDRISQLLRQSEARKATTHFTVIKGKNNSD